MQAEGPEFCVKVANFELEFFSGRPKRLAQFKIERIQKYLVTF